MSKSQLVQEFESRPSSNHGEGWQSLWNDGRFTLWDRGKPSPALIDLIEQNPDFLSPDNGRKKVLIPGCGTGYDVTMLALHGFDAYGLDVSEKGIEAAKQYSTKELANPQDYNFKHDNDRPKVSNPTTSFFVGNYFNDDWNLENLKFDMIYDYTFLCALHPTLRVKWASSMANNLLPGGYLICLEFPLYKDRLLPGPPWGLEGVHYNLLQEGGDGIDLDSKGDGKFVRILRIKANRTYEQGEGTDHISVYVKK